MGYLVHAARLAGSIAILMAPRLVAGQYFVDQAFGKMRFNFNQPGARAMGVGGAFIPLADDATAAETNPAGLTQLLHSELSAEARTFRQDNLVAADDTLVTAQQEFASFISVALPRDRMAVAAFAHRLMDYRARNVYRNNGTFQDTSWRESELSDIHLRVTNVGVAFATRVGDRLSIGAAAGISSLQSEWDNRFDSEDSTAGTEFDFIHTSNRYDVRGQRSGFLSVGVLLRPSERIVIGAVAKRRPTFRFTEVTYWSDTAGTDTMPSDFDFRLPNAAGAGFALALTSNLRLSVDAERVLYSRVSDGLKRAGADFLCDAPDATDVRAGFEYVRVIGSVPLAARGGAARSSRFNMGNDCGYGGAQEGADYQRTLNLGLGTVLLHRVQLDLAGSMSPDRSEFVLSGVWFFERRR